MIQFFDPKDDQLITSQSILDAINFIKTYRVHGLWDKWTLDLYGRSYEYIELQPYIFIRGGTPSSRIYGTVQVSTPFKDIFTHTLFNIIVNEIVVNNNATLILENCGIFKGQVNGSLVLSNTTIWGNLELSDNSVIATNGNCNIKGCNIWHGEILHSILTECQIGSDCTIFNCVLNNCTIEQHAVVKNCLIR